MRLPKLTKAQINEALDQTPMHTLLNVDKTSLTAKQVDFCEHLARGDSKAGAYRKAYKSKGKTATQANNGHKLSKRNDIQTMTDAIKAGIEFQKLYSAGQIRALVVQRLTQEAIADENSGSVRVNALRTLGTVAGVDAFQHMTVTKTIKDSDSAREELMTMLKATLADNQRTIDQDDVAQLMAEISSHPQANELASIQDPHTTLLTEGTPTPSLHTNPDNESDDVQLAADGYVVK